MDGKREREREKEAAQDRWQAREREEMGWKRTDG
jgi:hypothetical protein